MKTTAIQIREVLGDYDEKIKIYREPDNTLVFETDTGTIKIKDGTITLSGDIRIDGRKIGITGTPELITLTPLSLLLDAVLYLTSTLVAGYAGTDGFIVLNNAAGHPMIELKGSTGDANIKGGLNVGTETGSSAGEGAFSGKLKWLGVISAYGMFHVLGTLYTFRCSGATDITFAFTNIGDGKANVEVQGDITAGRNSITTGDSLVSGFQSTQGNALLATDLIRHTITTEEATSGHFEFNWQKADILKVISITTSLYRSAELQLESQARATSGSYYVPPAIRVFEGTIPWANGDIGIITVVYEK